MRFFIDITNAAGSKVGSGPITSASRWQSTKLLDRIGDFSFTMPAADPKAALIANRLFATCYAILPNGVAEVGAGIIDRVEYQPGPDGDVSLTVSGEDLFRELIWRNVGLSTISGAGSDLPDTHAAAVAQLELLAPAGWNFTADTSPPNDDIWYNFHGESLFAALAKVGELSRSHMWLSGSRALSYDSVWTDSGLRAIEAPSVADIEAFDNICYIGNLSAAVDSKDLVTRIYAYGQPIPDQPFIEYISSYHFTKSATGYTDGLELGVGYYLERDDAVALYGRVEEWKSYNEIKVPAATGSYVTTAANQMFDLALWELQRRGQPVSYYSLSLAHSPSIIRPMTTIRCIFSRFVDGRGVLNIDQDMYVMGATTVIDAEGMRTTDLEVATADRWQMSDIDPLRKLMQDNLRMNS